MNIINDVLLTVLSYLRADWLILLIGILFAVSINVYIDSEKLRAFLSRKSGLSIPGAVAFGTFTPLCACGTMAVLISMFVSAMPWGPVMAFLVSSPLTSPSEYMFETAFLGSKFATALLISSLVLGLLAGFTAFILERKTAFFRDQFRLAKSKSETCCTTTEEAPKSCYGKGTMIDLNTGFVQKLKLEKFAREFLNIGIKKVLLYFVIFIAIGRIVELVIPKEWIMTLFSGSKSYSVPLAASIGLPLYINDSSALPLLKSFMNAGAGEGAILAFLIAGKATGVPVIAGMSTFLRKRALMFYVGFIYFGAMIAGYIYQFML